jgi:hypothetical protein
LNAPTDPSLLGSRIAEAIGDGPPPARRLAQRERLVRSGSEEHRPRARAPLGWSAAAAAVLIAAIGAFVVLRGDPAPTIEPAAVAQSDGRWLEAPTDGALQIDLTEGTWVRVVDGARARVAAASAERGRISIESGRVEVEVDPAAARTWTVEAGPYEVVVVGTLFTVHWDPSSRSVEVEVVRGKVVVSGESLGAETIAVEAGHRLRADHARRTVTLSPLRPTPSVTAAVTDAPVEVPEEDDEAERRRSAKAQPRRARAAAPTWKDEAVAANYGEALALAKARGIDRMLVELSAGDLLLLADTARLARDRALARRVYAKVRERFASTGQASRAAFQLGRIAADGAGKHAEAARWFQTYLRESPSGAFAREARGRLVQSLDLSGDEAGARTAAKQYLALHPAGPHAKLAGSIAGGRP